ncbi:YfhD family protein [Peribacillus saganii]|uniref:YfhD family protein n=1 Tax=Peribacillus saganii TaxID=2303992 RepID=A0A372LM48_9BACI|nr:YfhD family protein [Peribacillus saganii]RFU68150.1 YfhD family protein [Peribacillus saganii]
MSGQQNNNKSSLPQTPKNMKRDGLDVEYSRELADADDIEAQQRSFEADQRAKSRQRNS